MTQPTNHHPFTEAGRTAARRLHLMHFLTALRATALYVLLPGVLGILALRLLHLRVPEWPLVIGILMFWLGFAFFRAWRRKPSVFQALATWDEFAGRKETFASAQFFETLESPTQGQKLHLQKSSALLKEALPSLPRDLALPRLKARWVLPILLLLTPFLPFLKPTTDPRNQLLTDSMQERAAIEAESLDFEDEVEKMKGLSKEEKLKAEEIAKSLEETADKLKQSRDKSAAEVLDELEKRARAAEKLAREIGDDNTGWASEAMLAEMRQHPDTADLADSIDDKKALPSAEEADEIALTLREPAITEDMRNRFDTALSRTMKAATKEDKTKIVGEHIGKASTKLEAKLAAEAGMEFTNLAKRFRRMAQREKAQKDLEELAEKLRQAGNNIAGNNQNAMKKLSPAAQGAKPLAGNPNQQPMPMLMPNQGQMPVPGLQQQPQGQGPGQQLPMLTPVPGQGNPLGKPMTLAPGNGKFDPTKPMMIAPIPGMPANGQPAALVQMPGVPGGQGGFAGGFEAGNGTTEDVNSDPTKPSAADFTGVVATSINEDGDSVVRAIEGQARTENASRDKQMLAADFINVQEDALDDQPLPASRREHVLRYFTELRKRYEAE